MKKSKIGVLVACIVVVIVVIILVWAWDECKLGKLSRAGCAAGFCGGAVDAGAAAEASAVRVVNGGESAPPSYSGSTGGLDGLSAQRLHRDRAAYRNRASYHENLRSNPAHMSAHRARMTSVRGVDGFAEGFGGPGAGFGWSPSETDERTPHGGWYDNQAAGHSVCLSACADGCNGSSCAAHCEETCRDPALQAATL